MTSSYYRGLAGAVITFDVTNRESFQNVQRWLADINKQAPADVVRILTGMKSIILKKNSNIQRKQNRFT